MSKTAQNTVNTTPQNGVIRRRADEERRQTMPPGHSSGKPLQTPTYTGKDRRKQRQTTTDLNVQKRRIDGYGLRLLLKFADITWITAIITLVLWNAYIGTNNHSVIAPIAAGCVGAAAFIGMLLCMESYRFVPAENYIEHLKRIAVASASALGLWLTFALTIRPATFLPDTLALSGLIATMGLFGLHTLYYIHTRRLHKASALTPNIVMLGVTDSARRLIEENSRTRELNIVAIFDERLSRTPHDIHGVPVVGKINDLLTWEDLPYIDRIVVTLPGIAQERKKQFIEKIRLLPNRIAFVVDEFENLDHVQQRLSQIAAIDMRDFGHTSISNLHTVLKRGVDIVLSGIALTVGAPVLALIALLIRMDSPGPALFKQPRHGFNNRVFDVYKFRSMRVETEDKAAAQQVTAGDSRVTKLGRFIRKTSLDELPQLINVFKGEMSLVGPRPHAVGMRTNDVESYQLVEEYAHRHKVKPGMTGWAQINGSRGPLHTAEDVARRVELDMAYIERSSVMFDFMIMFKTLPCLLGDRDNIR